MNQNIGNLSPRWQWSACCLAYGKTELEKKRQDAEKSIGAIRLELDRLQQRIQTKTNQGRSVKNLPQTARPSADARAAQGWVLLGECSKRYAGLAAIADEQRDDLARWQAWGGSGGWGRAA